MDDLLIDEMKDIYDAEQQLTKALPKMSKAASTPKLNAAAQKVEHYEIATYDTLRTFAEELGSRPTISTSEK